MKISRRCWSYCARLILVRKPRYREPRWSTLLPPEVHEFRSPAMLAALGARAARIQDRSGASGIHHAGALRGRRAGGARRDVRPVQADGRRNVGAALGLLALAAVRDEVGRAVSQGGGDVGARRDAAGPAECRGDSERRGPGALHAGDRAARPTAAFRRLVPPLPEHRRVPVLSSSRFGRYCAKRSRRSS